MSRFDDGRSMAPAIHARAFGTKVTVNASPTPEALAALGGGNVVATSVVTPAGQRRVTRFRKRKAPRSSKRSTVPERCNAQSWIRLAQLTGHDASFRNATAGPQSSLQWRVRGHDLAYGGGLGVVAWPLPKVRRAARPQPSSSSTGAPAAFAAG